MSPDRPPLRSPSPTTEALGESDLFVATQERLSRLALVDRPVLLVGERGTGKELAAQRIHYLSPRWQQPLVTLNCAALTPTLLESELFGYEPGAFTGARERRKGRFESAHGGSLFLDEIGNVPLAAQEKILRVVEYGEFERVGGSRTVQVDVRVIGATNADLRALADRGRFKWDLLDRLSFEVVRIPPLRERAEDILLLARQFAGRFAAELGRNEAPTFSTDALEALRSHPWPGNIRELKNTVERAVYATPENERVHHLVLDPFKGVFPDTPTAETAPVAVPARAELTLPEALDQLRLERLEEALRRARYNQRQAAELLGLSYHQFRGLYRKFAEHLPSSPT